MSERRLLAAAVVASLSLACGNPSEPGAESSLPAVSAGAAAEGVEVVDARVPLPAGDVAAVYLTVRDRTGRGDRLLGLESPAARSAMLHRTVIDAGRARMLPVTGGIQVPPGGSVRLEPGGLHGMLVGLEPPLKVGDRVALALRFERAGRVRVEAPVVARHASSAGPEEPGP